MKRKYVFFITISILFIPFFFTRSVFAKTISSQTIRVTPAYISQTTLPGKNISEDISIFNESKIPLNISLTARNVDYKGKRIYYNASESITNILSWIRVGQSNFIISPQSTLNVPVKINIPKNEKYGSYNGALIISNVTKGRGGNSRVVGSIVANVFINIRGNNKGYSNLNLEYPNLPFFIFNTPYKYIYSISNPGPYNNASLSTMHINSIFYNREIPSNLINLLVNQQRSVSFKIQNIPWGLYSVTLDTQNIGDNTNFTKTFYMVYFPIYIYIIIAVIIILIIFLIVRKRSKVKYS